MSVPFSDLRVAAYCPRKLYYRRKEPDRSPPESVCQRRSLAFQYDALLELEPDQLESQPIDVPAHVYQRRLNRLKEHRDDWDTIINPEARNVPVSGRECHGIVHKVLADPVRPAVISPGDPPENGVWEPHAVQAVAAAKALAWDRERQVDQAIVEYPAHGVVRTVSLSVRQKAAYRNAVRSARSVDAPPSRIDNSSKCAACEYSDQCGVKTRSLRSLLGD